MPVFIIRRIIMSLVCGSDQHDTILLHRSHLVIAKCNCITLPFCASFHLPDLSIGAGHQDYAGELWWRDPTVQRANRIPQKGDWGGRTLAGEIHQWVQTAGCVPDLTGERAGEIQEDHWEWRQQVIWLWMTWKQT